MRKFITSAVAALTAAGAVLATAGPANAERYRHRHRDNDDAVAAAIVGGVAGLALGAALSSGNRRDRGYYYNGYAYDPRYDRYAGGYYRYDRPYRYYDRPHRYRTCVTRDRVYDPYIGRRVYVERRYPC